MTNEPATPAEHVGYLETVEGSDLPADAGEDDLVERARRIAAADAESRGAVQTAMAFREGKADDSISVRVARAALTDNATTILSLRAQLEEAWGRIREMEAIRADDDVAMDIIHRAARALKEEPGR